VRARRPPLPGAGLAEAIRRIGQHAEEGASAVFCADPVFVLSAGWRCGSTLLQRLITSDGQTLVWGEPFGDHVPVHRLAQMLEPFATQDLHSPHSIEHQAGDLSRQWIANLNPGLAALRRAHLAWFEELFGSPAKSRGFRRWGCKWVRLGAEHAHYLRWLYPRCRILFLVRHPLDAWRSYRAQGGNWYLARPHARLEGAAAFLRHWARLSDSFLTEREGLGALLVRYEDLVDGSGTKAVAEALGSRIDEDVLAARVGASERRAAIGVGARLLCATRHRALLARLGYEARSTNPG
jgi:hypothetical protein